MENIKVSIIIPAYNVEEYIGDCLESIINQTYKNLEILVINDGSKDNTLNVINSYAEKDNRIKVVNQYNQGVSMARNNGIELSAGEYLAFIDADDLLPNKALEILLRECKENEAEVATGLMEKIKNGKKIEIGKLRKIKEIYTGKNALKEMLSEEIMTCSVSDKIFKKSVIGKERFDNNLKVAEDFEFLYRVLKKAKKVAINNQEVVYYYIVRQNSAMQGAFNNKFEKEIPLCEKIIEEIKNEYPEIIDSAIRRYQRAIVSCLSKCLKETGDTKEVEYLYDKLKKYPLKLKGYNRIRAYLLRYFKMGLKWIYKIYEKI